MANSNDTSLVALIALKVVCCGGLLLALGGVSLGSVLATIAGNGWMQAGGMALVALGAGWWLARKRWPQSCALDTAREDRRHDTALRHEQTKVPAE